MLKDILAAHFAAYPAMEPADAVKLIYQQEFGPEHLVKDGEKCLRMLREEMASLTPRPGEKIYESIGNGLCRVNLRPCLERGIPPEEIARLFLETAQAIQGDRKRFLKALKELEDMAENGETPFEALELDLYLIQYRDRGCPAVHHSPAYRAAYAPAYRVVLQKRLKDALSARR